jgi:ABC-type sugar transport system substrate-binding protein
MTTNRGSIVAARGSPGSPYARISNFRLGVAEYEFIVVTELAGQLEAQLR